MPCLCADAAVRHSTAATRLPADASSPARHAAAFRAKGHARCNRQGCATCGGRAGIARDFGLRLVEWRISTRAVVPAIATLAAARTGSSTAACRRFADSSARGLLVLPRRLRHAQRPAYDAILKIGVGHLVFARADAPAHRNPRLMHGLGIARDEWVPPVEVASLGQKAIGATGR